MNRSRTRTIVVVASGAMLVALVGCGGGSGRSGVSAPPATPPAANVSFERFVRDAMADEPSAPPREINDVPFTVEVEDDTFDDAFQI